MSEPIDPVCLVHGKKMSEHECLYCCLCFKPLTKEECAFLPDGQREDICVECRKLEIETGHRMLKEKNQQLSQSRAEVAMLRDALTTHDKWHFDHDDHDGYPESELYDMTHKALSSTSATDYVPKSEVENLQRVLENERANNPFYKELCGDFEKALGPHPRYDNGCWIKRVEELRISKERAEAALTGLLTRFLEPATCSGPKEWQEAVAFVRKEYAEEIRQVIEELKTPSKTSLPGARKSEV
jgi:hypothetical protein